MKSILILQESFIKKDQPDGTTLRIEGIKDWFQHRGFKIAATSHVDTKLLKNFNLLYLIVSTKKISLAANILKYLTPKNKLIIDLYNPIFLEKALSRNKLSNFLRSYREEGTVRKQLARGNHFLVANKNQLKFWFEKFKVLKIKNPPKQFSVLPTGIQTKKIKKNTTVKFRNRNIIVWFGGMYPWMNPSILIRGFSNIVRKYPNLKLRIIGGYNPKSQYLKIFTKNLKLAEKLIAPRNLEISKWQKDGKMGRIFEDVLVAVHIPLVTSEDVYSHRIRLLTLVNNAVPVITTGKDIISKTITSCKAGYKAKAQVHEIERAIIKMTKPEIFQKMSKSALKVQEKFIQDNLNIKNLLSFLNDKG